MKRLTAALILAGAILALTAGTTLADPGNGADPDPGRGRTTACSAIASNHATNDARAYGPLGCTGLLQICKQAAGPFVTGSFTFSVADRTVSVAAGGCSAPIELRAGTATVTEQARTGFELVGIQTTPADRLVGSSLQARTATVTILPGGAADQTTVTFINRAETGELRVCKVAGPGVSFGEPFGFTIQGPLTRFVTVPAGPPPVGTCASAGQFPVGSVVTVFENRPPGVTVSNISVAPWSQTAFTDRSGARAGVRIGAGATTVTFVNTRSPICTPFPC
jgi:hypothetical protein